MLENDEPITTVPQLTALDDRHFVAVAYQAVLGRAPDPEGEAYYLGRLRAGAHKLAILKQLRRSGEGRTFIPGVAGLDRAIKRHRWSTIPILGVVVRLITGEEGNGATHKRLRMLANDVGRLRSEQSALLAMIGQTSADWGKLPAEFLSPPAEAAAAPPPKLHLNHRSFPADLDSRERKVLGVLQRSSALKGARV